MQASHLSAVSGSRT